MAIKFDPNTLYSLAELEESLRGTVGIKTFLDRLGLRDNRVFRDAVFGWEILEASRNAEPYSQPNSPPSKGLNINPHRKLNSENEPLRLTRSDLREN